MPLALPLANTKETVLPIGAVKIGKAGCNVDTKSAKKS
jgi:hypothetical protein